MSIYCLFIVYLTLFIIYLASSIYYRLSGLPTCYLLLVYLVWENPICTTSRHVATRIHFDIPPSTFLAISIPSKQTSKQVNK